MTRTAIATDDGDEPRDGLLGELAGLLRKHGHADADDVWTEIHSLVEKVDRLAAEARERRCSGCCGHGHHYWYPASTGVTYGTYTTNTGTVSLPTTTVSYGTTPFT